MVGDESAQSTKQFSSRSFSTEADRPQLTITYTASTSVQDRPSTPKIFSLNQNYPNPFNPSTTISFSIPQSGVTTLKVFDLLGNTVGTLVNERLNAGSHSAVFDGRSLPSGIYFCRLESGGRIAVNKLMLLK